MKTTVLRGLALIASIGNRRVTRCKENVIAGVLTQSPKECL